MHLHVYMLHAPDFLGYEDAIQLAKDHPDAVKRGLRLKKVRQRFDDADRRSRNSSDQCQASAVFTKCLTKQQFKPITEELKWARDAAVETAKWVATLKFPDFERDYEFVAMRHPNEYPLADGRLVSNRGLDIEVKEYEQHFAEEHIKHSHALHSVLKARGAYSSGRWRVTV